MVKIPKKEKQKKESKARVKEKYIVALVPLIGLLMLFLFVDFNFGANDKKDKSYFISPDGDKVGIEKLIDDWWLAQDIAPREDISGLSLEEQKAIIESQESSEMNFSETDIFEGFELIREDGGEVQDLIIHVTIKKKIGTESITVPVRKYVDDPYADEDGEMDSQDIWRIKHGGTYNFVQDLSGKEWYARFKEDALRNYGAHYPSYDVVMDNYDYLEDTISGYPSRDESFWSGIDWHDDVSPISMGTGIVPAADENDDPIYNDVTLDLIAYENPGVSKSSLMKQAQIIYDIIDDSGNPHTLATYEGKGDYLFLDPTDNVPYEFANHGFYSGDAVKYMDLSAISDLKTVVWFEGDDIDSREHPGLGFWQERPKANLNSYKSLYGSQIEVTITQRLIIPRAADTTLKGVEIRIEREYDWAIYGNYIDGVYTVFKKPVRETNAESDSFIVNFSWGDTNDPFTLSLLELEEWNFWHGGAPIVEIIYSEDVGSDLGSFELKIKGVTTTDYTVDPDEDNDWSRQAIIDDYESQETQNFDQVWGHSLLKTNTISYVSVASIIGLFVLLILLKTKKR